VRSVQVRFIRFEPRFTLLEEALESVPLFFRPDAVSYYSQQVIRHLERQVIDESSIHFSPSISHF
jgi:hypothetical protein